MTNELETQLLEIKTGANTLQIAIPSRRANKVFANLVEQLTTLMREETPQQVNGQAINKLEEPHKHYPIEVNISTRSKTEEKPKFDLNNRKIRLTFMKCEECGTQVVVVVDDFNKPFKCKCCNHEMSYADTKFGSYTCKCGNTAKFYMTPNVSEVECKECGEKLYMMYEPNKDVYEGWEI